MKLYPHQREWLNAIRAEFISGAMSVMGQAPTGFGKTICFAHWANHAVSARQTVMIIVHRQEIFLQTAATITQVCRGGIRPIVSRPVEQMLYRSGPDQVAALVNYRSPIRVASIQTLSAQMSRGIDLPETDWLIVDEAHHADASTWAELIRHYQGRGARVLGVTATPERQDGRPLSSQFGGWFDSMVPGPSVEELVTGGFLAVPHVMQPRVKIDTSQFVGRMDRRGLGIEAKAREVYGDAVEEYVKHCPGEPAVAFCVSIKAAVELAERFSAAGFVACPVDGRMREDERRRRLEGLGNGSVHVVTSCDLISEGMDVPAVRAAFLLRPTESRPLYMQQVGRCLRTAPGKAAALVFDHSGNSMRHGHPMSPMRWSFHGVLECSSCRRVLPGGDTVCSCGAAGRPVVGRAQRDAVPSPKICRDCLLTWPAHFRRCAKCGEEFATTQRTVRQRDAVMADAGHERSAEIAAVIARAQADVWARVADGEDPDAAAAAAAAAYGLGIRWASDVAAYVREQVGSLPVQS